jgi:hypothetical protein
MPGRLLPGRNDGSGNGFGHADISFIRCDPTAGLAGELHRGKFAFADMVDADIVRPTEGAGNFFNGRVTQMTGIIGYSAATFTCMCHL